MKKVLLNAFVLLPLALVMIVYVHGKSEKKLAEKSKREEPKIADKQPADTCQLSIDK